MKRRRSVQPLATVRRALRRAMGSKRSIRVERAKGLSNYYGFPLALSEDLVLLQNVDDFRVDGYAVLPLKYITAIPTLATQQFSERVLRDSGRLKKVRLPAYQLELDDLAKCARSLAASRKMVIVECALADHEKQNTFFLGPIVAVSEGSLAIHHIDTDADWFDDPEVIPFADITDIRFDDEYSKIYKRYAPKLPAISSIEYPH